MNVSSFNRPPRLLACSSRSPFGGLVLAMRHVLVQYIANFYLLSQLPGPEIPIWVTSRLETRTKFKGKESKNRVCVAVQRIRVMPLTHVQ